MDNKVVQTLARAFVLCGWRSLRFNTAIAKLIELNNHLTKLGEVTVEEADTFVFVTDGACFTSQGCQNPTLTMMAITLRACDWCCQPRQAEPSYSKR